MRTMMNTRAGRWLKIALLPISCVLIWGIGFAQDRPDIRVTNPIELEFGKVRDNTLSVEQGDLVVIIATISNTETVPVTIPFDVVFQIQSNGEGEPRDLGASEVECLGIPNSQDRSRCTLPGLAELGKPGAQIEIKAQLNTSQLAPNVQYTVFVVADPTDVQNQQGKVLETDESNNFGQGLLTVKLDPNLTPLAETSLLPPQPQQGDLFSIEFTIENDRGIAVITPFRIDLALRKRGERTFQPLVPPALSCPDCTVSGLEANGRKVIRAQLVTVLLDPGAYQLRVTVDPDGIIPEADETDNVLTVDFVLGDPPRNLTLSAPQLTPPTPTPGREIKLDLTIQNDSIGIATGVKLQFLLRQLEPDTPHALVSFVCEPVASFDPDKAMCTLPTLGSNQALRVEARFRAQDLPLGNYELRAIVDPQGEIAETNEQDNTLLIPFALVKPGEETPQIGPELHPIGLALVPGSPVVQGQKVLVNATITNSGNQDAQEFRVEFSFRRQDASQQQGFTSFGTQTISALRLGKTIEVRSIFDTTNLEPGLYAIQVNVNALGQAELDGNNNAIIAFLTVAPKP